MSHLPKAFTSSFNHQYVHTSIRVAIQYHAFIRTRRAKVHMQRHRLQQTYLTVGLKRGQLKELNLSVAEIGVTCYNYYHWRSAVSIQFNRRLSNELKNFSCIVHSLGTRNKITDINYVGCISV